MANMNITSMVTPRYRQLQAETQDDIAIAPSVSTLTHPLDRAQAELPMKPQLTLGDRVELTERGVRLAGRQAKIDWPNRRGTVRHITKHSEAHVQWDGRKSADVLPVVILERCSKNAP